MKIKYGFSADVATTIDLYDDDEHSLATALLDAIAETVEAFGCDLDGRDLRRLTYAHGEMHIETTTDYEDSSILREYSDDEDKEVYA